MATQFNPALYNFRTKFKIPDKNVLQWFPGHMNKGMKQMQQKLKTVDCIIEVHDARIPFSGRNPNFKTTISAIKPHILVLNKKDLAPSSVKPKVIEILKKEGIDNVVFTNSKNQRDKGVKSLTPLMVDLISSSNRYNRSENKEYNVMIIGVPNVGKSSLINVLRSHNTNRAHSMPVGAIAGITRSVMMKMKICEDPPIFMLDTPGILEPSVTNAEMGLKLALCASLQDHLVGEDIISDYLLYWLNKNNVFSYVDLMGLTEPSDNITKVLISGCVKYDKFRIVRQYDGSKVKLPDTDSMAKLMLHAFRKGELGSLFLDKDIIQQTN